MSEDLHHEPRSIMLPVLVLDALKDLPAGALKVLIYLCSPPSRRPYRRLQTRPEFSSGPSLQPSRPSKNKNSSPAFREAAINQTSTAFPSRRFRKPPRLRARN